MIRPSKILYRNLKPLSNELSRRKRLSYLRLRRHIRRIRLKKPSREKN